MDVEVSTRGSVAPDLAQLAAEKVGALDAAVQRPLTPQVTCTPAGTIAQSNHA